MIFPLYQFVYFGLLFFVTVRLLCVEETVNNVDDGHTDGHAGNVDHGYTYTHADARTWYEIVRRGTILGRNVRIYTA